MLETWDWYWERFRDNAVLLAMYPRRFVRSGGVAGHSGQTKELPYEVKQIAEQLKRKETSVLRSLHRLLRRGKVERHENGWRAK